MSWMPRPVSPRAAISDFLAFTRQRSREQVIGATLAVLVTMIIVVEFFIDSKINTAPPATLTYVESWPADRPDSEIMADQKVHQAKREKLQEERRRKFQKLEKQLGM